MLEDRRPGPSGPARSSPTGGSFRSAARTSFDMLASCQSISSLMASGRSGAASPLALAAYAAAPRAWAPRCGIAEACPAARAAAAAAVLTPCAARPRSNRRRICSATSSSPRPNARVRAIASRGRLSPGASASKKGSTRPAHSAAQAATIRRSASLSVCGEPIAGACQLWVAHPLPIVQEHETDTDEIPATRGFRYPDVASAVAAGSRAPRCVHTAQSTSRTSSFGSRVGRRKRKSSAYARAMLRLGSCVGPAGRSPVQVSAKAPGSRPQPRGEIPAAERGVKSLFGGSKRAGWDGSLDKGTIGEPSRSFHGEGHVRQSWFRIGCGGSSRGTETCTRVRSDHGTRETRLASLVGQVPSVGVGAGRTE